MAFSPDGRLLFVGLLNGAGQFYSTRDWRPVGGRIRGQEQRLLNARFTPDGRTLATSSADGTRHAVGRRHAASRSGRRCTVERDSFVAAAMSRDGAYLYALPTGTEGVRLALSPRPGSGRRARSRAASSRPREWADALPGRAYRASAAGNRRSTASIP